MMQRIVSIVHEKKQKAILAKQEAGEDIGMCEISRYISLSSSHIFTDKQQMSQLMKLSMASLGETDGPWAMVSLLQEWNQMVSQPMTDSAQ